MMNRAYQFFFGNLITKIVSILVAIALWVIVLSSKKIDLMKDIPLAVVTSSDVVVANDLPDRVTFQLTGPQAFRRAVQERNESPIKINLAGVKPGTVTYTFSSDDVHLPLGMKVGPINPPSVRIRLEPVRFITVKVRADLRGEPEKGFRISKVEVRPSEVQLRGARAALANISELIAAPVDVAGINKSMTTPLSFEVSHLGVSLDGPPPVLSVDVEPINPNFRLKNVTVRVLSGLKYTLSDPAVTVFVRASPEDLRALDHSRVYAEIDLRGQKKGKYTVNLKVNAPKAIGILRVVPEKVQVTLY
jgi:YbbR domain-containing protein